MISSALEAGREHQTEKEIVISINRHLVLELAEMQERVGGSRVVVEGGHYKLSQETKRGDFL